MNESEWLKNSLQVTLDRMTRQMGEEINELEKIIKQSAHSKADTQNTLEEDLVQLFDNFQTAYSDVQNRLSLLAILMKQKQEVEVERSSLNEKKSDSMGNPALILRPDKKHHNKEHKPGDSDSRHPLLMIAYQENHNKSLSSNTQTVGKSQATPQLSPELGDEYVTPVAKEVAEGTQSSYWAERKLKTQEGEEERPSVNDEESGSKDNSMVAKELEKQHHHQENASEERGSQWLLPYRAVARSKQLKSPQESNSNSSTAVNQTKDKGRPEEHTKSLSSGSQEAAQSQTTAQLSAELAEKSVTAVTNEVAEGTQPSYWTERKLKTQEREKDQKSTDAPVRQETNASSSSERDPSELQIGWPDKTDKQPRERQARRLSEIFTDFIYSKIRLIILLRNCIRWRQSPLQSKQWQFLICLLLGLFLGAGATVFLFYGVPDAIIMGMSRSWATYFPVLVLGMFILFLGSSALSKRLRSIFFYVVTLTWSALIGWHLVTQSLITSPEFDFIATQLSNSMALINWIIAVGCIVFAAQFLTFKKLRPVVLTYSYGFLLAAVITLGLVYVSPTRFI